MGKYGDVMTNNPRYVTRALANPIFWSIFGAHVIGVLLGGAEVPPWWVGALTGLAFAIVTNAIDRWWVTARAKQIATQGIADAAAMRPDVFR